MDDPPILLVLLGFFFLVVVLLVLWLGTLSLILSLLYMPTRGEEEEPVLHEQPTREMRRLCRYP